MMVMEKQQQLILTTSFQDILLKPISACQIILDFAAGRNDGGDSK